MEAQFDSRCSACDGYIDRGEEIVNDEYHGWVHEDCADMPTDGPTRRQVMDALSATEGPHDVSAAAHAVLDLDARAQERRAAAGYGAVIDALADEVGDPGTVADAVAAELTDRGRLDGWLDQDKTVVYLPDAKPQPEYVSKDRWKRYVLSHPSKPDGRVTLTRCTTFNSAVDDMFSLSGWQKGNVAVGLARRPDLLARAAGMKSGDRDLKQIVAAAEEAGGGSVKANLGTAMHTFTEMVDWGRPLEDVPDMYRDDVAAYMDALVSERLTVIPAGIERITMTARWDGVAGKLDRVYRLADGSYVIGDVKSGKVDYDPKKIFGQLAMYAQGVNEVGVYDVAGARWERLPFEVRTDTALIMHMAAGEGTCVVYEADLEVGRAHLDKCMEVRRHRKIKHRLARYTPPERSGAEWVEEITATRTRDGLAAVGRVLKAREAMTPELFALAMRHRETLPE